MPLAFLGTQAPNSDDGAAAPIRRPLTLPAYSYDGHRSSHEREGVTSTWSSVRN